MSYRLGRCDNHVVHTPFDAQEVGCHKGDPQLHLVGSWRESPSQCSPHDRRPSWIAVFIAGNESPIDISIDVDLLVRFNLSFVLLLRGLITGVGDVELCSKLVLCAWTDG